MKNNLIFNIGLILFVILYPLLMPGYMFSLDQAFSVHGWIPKVGDNIFWIGYTSKAFALLGISTWILEKIIIFGGFILLCVGGYFLTKKWKSYEASSFAIILLLFNPFLYGRFIDGQINVYLSYFLYPLFFYFLHKSFLDGSIKNIIFTAGISLFLCLTSLHNSVFLFFIGIIFALVYGFLEKKYKNILYSGFAIGVVNLIWLIPLLFSSVKKGALFSQISEFGESAFSAFATGHGVTNIYFNVLSLHGYWGERMGRFVPTWDYNFAWWFIFLLIFFLVVYGIYKVIHQKNTFGIALFFLLCTSYIFSFGVAEGNIFFSINTLMYEYFPFYSGFREPHKWVMFLVISYAYFGAYAIQLLQKNKFFQKINKKGILFTGLGILPVFYVFGTFNGFGKQVVVKEYPKEWYELREVYQEEYSTNCEYFEQMGTCYSSLVLPWHSYMSFSFLDNKRTLISVTNFFGNHLLRSDNIEIGEIYSFSHRFESKKVEKYLAQLKVINLEIGKDFIKELKKMGIHSIFFFKESDYKVYMPLFEILEVHNLLQKRWIGDNFILYEIL